MVTTVTLSTQFPLHSGGTQALKAPYVINARGTFTTRVLSTFIFICRKNIEQSPMECLKPPSNIGKLCHDSDSCICVSSNPLSNMPSVHFMRKLQLTKDKHFYNHYK